MCGFVSIHTAARPLHDRRSVVERMLARISHRGPDGEGFHHVPHQALFGHRRLAIIDLAHGHQPMLSQDERFSLVFNGEIYNYLELAERLAKDGFTCETLSDTEVLLRWLIRHGPAGLLDLNGMFSFILHDRSENRWLAARDHFGIKPLYYGQTGEELLFASEIKALFAHPEFKPERDNKSLQQYLAFQFCLDDRTLFKGVRKVRPGHYLSGRGNIIEKDVCYWDTNYHIDYDHTAEWFESELAGLLQDSIRLQMRSDVPVGAYLSGGLDSSLVSALASRRSEQPLPLFHGRFAEGPAYDESQHARHVSEEVGGVLHEVVPRPSDFAEQLPGLIYSLDEPLAGPGLFPQSMTSRLAAKHSKVVLGGQGGDEIFGGYARYLVGYLEQALKGAILQTQEEGRHLVTLESIVPNLALLRDYTPLLGSFWREGLFGAMDARYFNLIDRSQGMESVLHADALSLINREELFADFQTIFNHADTISYINKMTHFDQKTLLPALLQIEDRVSMAVSIESRVPLLDRRVVDLVTAMPPPLKFQGGQTKHLLKKAARGVVPASVIERKDKMGFPVPLKEWMQGGVVRDFVGDVLLSRDSLERGIYSEKALRGMMCNAGVAGRQLWGALSLELWHRQFIDAA
jgi:asparagine synthase (glutamine-hydrolysing)